MSVNGDSWSVVKATILLYMAARGFPLDWTDPPAFWKFNACRVMIYDKRNRNAWIEVVLIIWMEYISCMVSRMLTFDRAGVIISFRITCSAEVVWSSRAYVRKHWTNAAFTVGSDGLVFISFNAVASAVDKWLCSVSLIRVMRCKWMWVPTSLRRHPSCCTLHTTSFSFAAYPFVLQNKRKTFASAH